MGRYLPVKCQHGVTVDYGDFGPCDDCDDHEGEECPNLPVCRQCDELRRHRDHAIEVGERFMSCHRSGFQVDCGRHTYDRAGDFYAWLATGDTA